MHRLFGGVRVALTLIAGLCVVVLGVIALVRAVGHYEVLVVRSGSMAPAMRSGDLAVVRPVGSDTLRVGDVITYRWPLEPELLITHRVVRTEAADERLRVFWTMGDANRVRDPWVMSSG